MSFGKIHQIPHESSMADLAYAAGVAEAQALKDRDDLQAIVLRDYIANSVEDKLIAAKQLCENPNFMPFFSDLVATLTTEMTIEPMPQSDEAIPTMFEQHLYGGDHLAIAETVHKHE